MELSLSPLASFKFPAIRPTLNGFSHQTKTQVNLSRNFDHPIFKHVRNLPSKGRGNLSSFSKLAPYGSYWRKPVPIRVHTDQLGAKNSEFEHVAEELEQKIANNYGSEAGSAGKVEQKSTNKAYVFWKFARSFVVISSIVQVGVFVARTWMENSHLLQWSNGAPILIRTLAAVVAQLCAGIYTSGVNQIHDVEIDRINKPELPIAAGELSLQNAWLLVTLYVAVGLSAAGLTNSGLFVALICVHFFLASIYSIPPIRLKESTIGATVVCGLIQGFPVIFCLQASARATLGLPYRLSPPVIFMAIFSTVYAFTMGLIKDIGDVEGDKKYNIRTLAMVLGVENVVFMGCSIILVNFVSAILVALFMPQAFKRHIMIPAHVFHAVGLINQALKLHRANYSKEGCVEFYQFCWMLFYAEFLLFPFI